MSAQQGGLPGRGGELKRWAVSVGTGEGTGACGPVGAAICELGPFQSHLRGWLSHSTLTEWALGAQGTGEKCLREP